MADCIDLMLKASNGVISKKEASDFIKSLMKEKDNYLSPEGKSFLKNSEQYNPASLVQHLQSVAQQKFQGEMISKLKENYQQVFQKRAAANVEAEARARGQRTGPIHGLVETVFQHGKEQRALTQDTLGKVGEGLRKAGVSDPFFDKSMEKDWFREISEMNKTGGGNPGITKNPVALKIARVLQPIMMGAKDRLNRAGALIFDHDGFVMRRVYDRNLVEKTDPKAFAKDIRDHLDLDKTYGPQGEKETDKQYQERINNAIEQTRKGIISGKHNDEFRSLDANDSDYAPPGNLASSFSKSRKFQFKDSGAEYDFLNKYGPASVTDMYLRNLSRMAEKTALIEKFGPNPRNTLQSLFDSFQEEHRESLGPESPAWNRSNLLENKGNAFERLIAKAKPNDDKLMDWAIKEVMGETKEPGSRAAASSVKNVMDFFRVLVNSATLGKAVFSAQSDLANSMSFLRSMGMDAGVAFKHIAGVYYNPAEGKNLEEAGYATRVAGDSMMHGLVDTRYAANDLLNGKAAALQDTFLKMTGLFQHDNRIKKALAQAMRYWLGYNSDKAFEELPEGLAATLKDYGLTPQEWDIWRSQAYEDLDGKKILDRNYDNLEDKIHPLVQGASTQANYERAIDALDKKVGGLFADASDHAVPRLGVRERTYLYRGTSATEGWGYFARLIAQLRTFPIAQVSRNLSLALNKGRGGLGGLAYLTATSTIFGGMAVAAKQLTSGVDPTSEWRNGHYVKASLQALTGGGGLGILGDVLFPDMDQKDSTGSFANLVLGPVLGKVGNVYDMGKAASKGDGKEALKDLINTGSQLTPFNNWWATHYLFNYLVKNAALEMANPGHTARMQRYAEQEKGSQYILPPSIIGSN